MLNTLEEAHGIFELFHRYALRTSYSSIYTNHARTGAPVGWCWRVPASRNWQDMARHGKTWACQNRKTLPHTPMDTHKHTRKHTHTRTRAHAYAHPHTHLEVQPHIVKSTVGPPAISSVRRGKTVQSRPAECVCLMPVSL
jgi:hypothetical protein